MEGASSYRLRRTVAIAASGAILAVLAVTQVRAATQTVQIRFFAYTPQTITVHVGNTVTWTNGDTAPHTATADDGSFNTGMIVQGASASVTLTRAGTFTYHCIIHPDMVATLVVTAAAPATSTIAPGDRQLAGGLPVPLALAAGTVGGLALVRWRLRRA